jgi:zinc protease
MLKQVCTMVLCSAVLCSLVTSCKRSVLAATEVELGKELANISGQLDNGFTYYVKANAYDQKKASLRLAVKVGSVLEEETQRGLAHFLEHMVFRGTESYSDGEVIDYLESIGASFGADTNAYTSYDETVYMFEIPLEREGSLEQAIAILSEFSMKASLADEQLSIEKNVVLDEIRLRTGTVQGRSSNKLLELLLQGTLYADRNPIGLEDVVKNCTPEQLRAFYTKWYRPENMALIAVGDFSSDEVLSYIDRYFGGLPASKDVAPIVRPEIKAFGKQLVNIYKDPESVNSVFITGSWIRSNQYASEEDFRKDLLDALIISMANRRFSIKSQEEAAPFQSASVGLVNWLHSATCIVQQCVCWDQEPLRGLEVLTLEMQKMHQQGFTQSELDIAIAQCKNGLKVAIENADKHKNLEYATHYIQHFMGKASPLSFGEGALLRARLLDTVSLSEINERKSALFKIQEQLTVFLPSAKARALSEEQMSALLAQKVIFDPQTPESQKKPEIDCTTQFAPGTIVQKTSFEKTGIKKWMLSNGMTVYLEHTPLKENLISIALKAEGGLSSYDAALYPSATISFTYLQKSGLAGLSHTELQDALAGKHADMMYMMGLNSRHVQGEIAKRDLEVGFKLMQALFTDRFYREESWNQQMKTVDQMYELKDHNPDIQFYKDVTRFDYKNHYFVEDYNSQRMNREESEKILNEAFRNPSEYTLVIAGDYDEDVLAYCIEKYLGAIPQSKESFPESVIKNFEFPEGINHRDLEYDSLGQEGTIYWSCPLEEKQLGETYEDFYTMKLAEHIIKTRLLKKLRKEVGETYGVHCALYFPFAPKMTSGKFFAFFSTSKETIESMKILLIEEIQHIKETPPSVEEISAAQEIMKHHHLQRLQTNAGRVERILEQLDFGAEPDHFVAERESLLTQDSVHQVMDSMLNMTNYSLHAKIPR